MFQLDVQARFEKQSLSEAFIKRCPSGMVLAGAWLFDDGNPLPFHADCSAETSEKTADKTFFRYSMFGP